MFFEMKSWNSITIIWGMGQTFRAWVLLFSCKLPQNFGLDLSEKCCIECGNLDYPYRLFRMTEPGVCQVESSNSYFCANIFVRSGPRVVLCHFVINMCSRSKFRGYVKIVTIGSNLDVQGE